MRPTIAVTCAAALLIGSVAAHVGAQDRPAAPPATAGAPAGDAGGQCEGHDLVAKGRHALGFGHVLVVVDGEQPHAPIREVFSHELRPLIAAILSRVGPDVLYALFTVFTLTYGIQSLGYERNQVLTAVLIGSAFQLFMIPLAGAVSDRFNRRLVYGVGAVVGAVWTFIFFAILGGNNQPMLINGIVLGLMPNSIMYGPHASFIVEQFSPRLRSTGSSLAYTFAGVIGGAIAPLMFTLLLSQFGTWIPVAIYVAVAAAVTLVGLALGRDNDTVEDLDYRLLLEGTGAAPQQAGAGEAK